MVRFILPIVIGLALLAACGGSGEDSAPTPTSSALPAASATSFASPAPSATPPSELPTSIGTTTAYVNPAYHVELSYPSAWRPDPGYANIGGGIEEAFRDSRSRLYGFFEVDALSGPGFTVDQAAATLAQHQLKPYGENPIVEPISVDGLDARLVLPDPATDIFDTALVVPYPTPVAIGSPEQFSFLIIYAHKDWVRSLAETVVVTP